MFAPVCERRSWSWNQPAAPPPPPLAVLDTLGEGYHADPISWCRALCPTPGCIYLPVPLRHLCSPLQEPGALLSPDVINACLLQKGQSISLPGRWWVVGWLGRVGGDCWRPQHNHRKGGNKGGCEDVCRGEEEIIRR